MTEQRRCRRCNQPIAVGPLACRKHWYDLPIALRGQIIFAFREKRREDYAACVQQADQVWEQLEGSPPEAA